jgi:flagellum-specific peptidoglycan hydrolase FlgJ
MMKSKYGAALKAKNTTQYAKALKAGGYYQDSLENYTNKLNAMSSMSAAAKRHRLLNPKMYEY